jgi:hypothetical protein
MSDAHLVEEALATIRKSIESTDVSGLLLVREDLQAELAIEAPTATPVRNRLNRIQGNGRAHSWYKLVPTSASEGLFLGTNPANMFFEKGGLPNASTPAYKYMSAPYTAIGDLVTVSFQDQMSGATYTDVKKHQIRVKMVNVARGEEWAIINGDSAVDPKQFDGLLKQITTNTTDLMGVNLSLSDITDMERTIVTRGGKPQAVVAGYREVQRISELVLGSFYRLTQVGAGAMADVPAGVSITRWVNAFGTVDIIGSEFLVPDGEDEASLIVLDDKTVLEDGNVVQMVDLMPLSAIDLALLGSAYRTLVCEFTVLMVAAEAFQGKITGIGTTEPA